MQKQPSEEVFYKKDFLKTFANFSGNNLCWSVFNKVYSKETPAWLFSGEIYENFKSTYFEEHLNDFF